MRFLSLKLNKLFPPHIFVQAIKNVKLYASYFFNQNSVKNKNLF